MSDIPTEATEAAARAIAADDSRDFDSASDDDRAEWLDHAELVITAALPHLPQHVSPSVEEVRAEAVRRWPDPHAVHGSAGYCRGGFIEGAQWAATSSQQTVEQVVEAARCEHGIPLIDLCQYVENTINGKYLPGHIREQVRREALESAADILRDYRDASPTPSLDDAVEVWLRRGAPAPEHSQTESRDGLWVCATCGWQYGTEPFDKVLIRRHLTDVRARAAEAGEPR